MSVGPNRFALPDQCCLCLGKSEMMYEASWLGGKEGGTTETRLDVPLCRRCHARMKLQKRVAGLVFAAMAAAGAYSIYDTESSGTASWIMVLGTTGLVLGLMGLLTLGVGLLEPVSAPTGRIVFRNKQYQRLFEDANGLTA